MSYQKEREEFLVSMQKEGVPLDVARLVLRDASTIQRLAEVACSDEAADRDRVRCPGDRKGDAESCLCRDGGYAPDQPTHCPAGTCLATEPCVHPATFVHGKVPRYMIRDEQAQVRIAKRLAPFNVVPDFQGDPRGACVKLKVPSGRTDDWGRVGLCVPTRGA